MFFTIGTLAILLNKIGLGPIPIFDLRGVKDFGFYTTATYLKSSPHLIFMTPPFVHSVNVSTMLRYSACNLHVNGPTHIIVDATPLRA